MTVASVGFVGAAAKMGMAAVESESLVATTFGNMTSEINKWSNNASEKLGFNAFEMRRQAAQFQNLFTAGGMGAGKAAEMSKAFVEAKQDLVSFYNVADPEVFAALQSGINGEAEPLRRFGIYLSDATIKTYAYQNGIAKAGDELSELQKQQARAGFILATFRKGNAFGDAERTKDSPANVLRRQQNELKQAMTGIGMSLMPLTSDVLKLTNQMVPKIKEAVKWFTGLDETSRRWVLGIALGLGPLTKLVGFSKELLGNVKGVAGLLRGGKDDPGGKAGGALGGAVTVALMKVNAASVVVNGGAPGGGGASAAGGAGALAARAGLTGATAFGMGPVATGAVIATGAVAAAKLPTYMREATTKSDEDMAKSSDPVQRWHGWGGGMAARFANRFKRGASIAHKMLAYNADYDSAARLTTWDEDEGYRAGEGSKRISQNSKAEKYRRWKKQMDAEAPKRAADHEKWLEQNSPGFIGMRAQQRLEANRLSSVNTDSPDNRRSLTEKWAGRRFGKKGAEGYMEQWDKSRSRSMLTDKLDEMKKRKPSANERQAAATFGLMSEEEGSEKPLTARGRAVAEKFGFVPEEEGKGRTQLTFDGQGDDGASEARASGRGVRMPNGGIRITFDPVEIAEGESDRQARQSQFIASTPSPVI